MRFLSSLVLLCLPVLLPHGSCSLISSSSSPIITLPLNRRHMSIQASRGDMDKPYHEFNKQDKYHKFMHMAAQPPLSGCPFLDFTTPVTIGGRTFDLIVDTGSSSLAVASNACPNCPNPKYTPTPTNVVQGAPTATSRFGDGSGWTGRVIQDQVSLNGSPAVPVAFAAIDTQTNNFFSPGTCTNPKAPSGITQGIIGFAYQSLAVSTTNTFFGQLVKNTGISNMFSMMECYTTGTMTLGGVTPGESSGLFYYTPIIQKAWYVIRVTDMRLGSQSLGLSAATFQNNAGGGPANAIVDNGTSLMILPPAAFNAIMAALNRNAAFNAAFGQGAAAAFQQGRCLPLRNGLTGQAAINFINQNLPPLNIVVEAGFTLNLSPATGYFIPFDAQINAFCLGIENGGSTITIFGWPFVNQFVVVYDVQNSQIGFATQVGCNNGAGGTITPGTAKGQPAPGSGTNAGTTVPVQPTAAPTTAVTVAPTQAIATTAPTTAPTAAPTTAPTKPPTATPPNTTMNCPRGRFGPTCSMVYDILQCVIRLSFAVVSRPGYNGNTFSKQFAVDMSAAANTTSNNIMVLQILDRGDGGSTIVQFAMLADSRQALVAAENKLARNFFTAAQKLIQDTLFGALSADQGLTILENAGSGADGINQDGVMMPDDGIPLGAIVAPVAGGVILIILVAGIIIHRRRKSASKRTTNTTIVQASKPPPAMPMTTVTQQPSNVGWVV